MRAASPGQDHDSAFQLVAGILQAVEDEFSGIPADPSPGFISDGRMYPPQDDRASPCSELPGTTVYRSQGHRTYIGANGAIAIILISSGKIQLNKPGADGISLALTSLDG